MHRHYWYKALCEHVSGQLTPFEGFIAAEGPLAAVDKVKEESKLWMIKGIHSVRIYTLDDKGAIPDEYELAVNIAEGSTHRPNLHKPSIKSPFKGPFKGQTYLTTVDKYDDAEWCEKLPSIERYATKTAIPQKENAL